MVFKVKKELVNSLLTVLAALFSVIALYTFVVPADFSPSGIDGLSTILYELTGLNMGWYKLLINIPLFILGLIFLGRKYMIYVIIFTLLDSAGTIVLEELNFYTYVPVGFEMTEIIGYRLIATLISGVLLGVSVGIMLKIGFSTGGVDIIASLFHIKKQHFKVERIISVCSYTIVGISFFVYRDLTSIILSVIQIFVSEYIVSTILKNGRFGIEVKVVTKSPEILKEEIICRYKHSATVLKSQGMYSGEDNYMVISVMNTSEIPSFMDTMKKFPDSFVYFSGGVRIQGDYHFKDEDVGKWTPAFK